MYSLKERLYQPRSKKMMNLHEITTNEMRLENKGKRRESLGRFGMSDLSSMAVGRDASTELIGVSGKLDHGHQADSYYSRMVSLKVCD